MVLMAAGGVPIKPLKWALRANRRAVGLLLGQQGSRPLRRQGKNPLVKFEDRGQNLNQKEKERGGTLRKKWVGGI